jgi:hypothetical protein
VQRRIVFVLVLAALVLTVSAAAIRAAVPARYRYTGWVSQVRGNRPQHMVVVAGPLRFLFNDYANSAPSATEPYRLCYRRIGRPQRCVNRTVTGTRPDAVRRTLGRTGQYVARWYVGGHAVASWSFLVVQGD